MLSLHDFAIRRLEAPDVHAVLTVIAAGRREFGLEPRVPAILEPSDHDLFETYRTRRAAYFVATVNEQVVGGAGISRLDHADGSVCELQRMYVGRGNRGFGIGHALLQECLRAARRLGYRHCYAETVSEMTTAIAFYERHGFEQLKAPLGETRGSDNDRWLLLKLHSQPHGADVSI